MPVCLAWSEEWDMVLEPPGDKSTSNREIRTLKLSSDGRAERQ
jgi:hypothetical protein